MDQAEFKRKYPAVKADFATLAKSALRLIEQHPDSLCLTMGMLPSAIMYGLEAALKEKIPNGPNGSINRTLTEKGEWEPPLFDGAECRKDIIHITTCMILRLATEQVLCLV